MSNEIECPEYLSDVMVSIGLSAKYTNGKTIKEVKGLGEYPKTEIGKFILNTVDNAMSRVAHIRGLPEESRQAWSALVKQQYAIGFKLQQMENFKRLISTILHHPTSEQRALVAEYYELARKMQQATLQPTLLQVQP